MLGRVTWKMLYIVTVSGRFPEYSDTLKMSIPHLFMSSNSCQWTTSTNIYHYNIRYKEEYIKLEINKCSTSRHTLARNPSWLVLTPKRGMVEGARLGLWVAFFTPLIWDMGLFFLSLSLVGGDMMSMSCCFSVRWKQTTHEHCILLLHNAVVLRYF